MLDITSYRRKQKYAEPLTVMRELYHEYSRSHKSKTIGPQADQDPLARQTLSVDKFSKCLKQLQNHNCHTSDLLPKSAVNNKQFGSEFEIVEYDLLPVCQSESHRFRIQNQSNIFKKQQCYFKSSFSSTVSLFNAHPAIRKVHSNDHSHPQFDNNKKPQIPNILFQRKQQQMRNATHQFKQMVKLKEKIELQQNVKKTRLRKMRHDWICNNLYHVNEDVQPRALNNALTSISQIRTKDRARTRDHLSHTKENIFPK